LAPTQSFQTIANAPGGTRAAPRRTRGASAARFAADFRLRRPRSRNASPFSAAS
jgi:hypothetical protein